MNPYFSSGDSFFKKSMKNPKINFYILTLFPDSFRSYFNTSLLKRAQKRNLIKIHLIDLRKFASDRHKSVDDRPYGGGPGMVLKVEPIYQAVKKIKKKIKKGKALVILFSLRGKKFNQKEAERLSQFQHLILICGRYEGVDERVAKYIADEEISVGDYILTGGEIPAMIVVDTVSRLIPGMVGNISSLEELKGSYPVYTRPAIFYPEPKNKKKRWPVPKVLLSGNHKKIEEWRKKKDKLKFI